MDNESLLQCNWRESPLRLVLVLTTSSVVQTEFSTSSIIYEWKQLQVYKQLAIKWKTVKHTRKTTNIKEKLMLAKKIEVWRHKNLNLWNYGIRKKSTRGKNQPVNANWWGDICTVMPWWLQTNPSNASTGPWNFPNSILDLNCCSEEVKDQGYFQTMFPKTAKSYPVWVGHPFAPHIRHEARMRLSAPLPWASHSDSSSVASHNLSLVARRVWWEGRKSGKETTGKSCVKKLFFKSKILWDRISSI